ncbi:MAG: Asp23/Gls24 family envelope stress response protein [Defluviitaleaceae bacterium]|nr:Asp23/Gls24 family envelope stress response protein [Defluviitaleaceae bacterium]
MTELKKESGGVVRIADEVLTIIAGTAAMEADGVLRLAWISGGKTMRRQMAKCTSVVVRGKTVTIGLSIAVRMGTKIHEVSVDVQKRVKAAIETMTGLSVAEVNVSVKAIVGEKKKA